MDILIFIVLVFGGLVFLVWQLLKNTKITDGIANHLAAKTSDAAIEKLTATVEEIRDGQKISNAERKSQAADIAELKQSVCENKYDTLCLSKEVHRIRIALRLPSTSTSQEGQES